MPRTIILLLSLLTVPLTAGAQQEPDKHTGELVYVRQEGSATEIRGNLLELGPDTIAILSNGTRLDLPLSSVERVQAKGDSLKNGALIGALVFGGSTALAFFNGSTEPAFWLSVVAFNTGWGALIGVGIDALHNGRTTIYREHSEPKRVALQYSFRW